MELYCLAPTLTGLKFLKCSFFNEGVYCTFKKLPRQILRYLPGNYLKTNIYTKMRSTKQNLCVSTGFPTEKDINKKFLIGPVHGFKFSFLIHLDSVYV